MSKELTPLEALEKLTNYKCSRLSEKVQCKEIIETALKELEMLKEIRITATQSPKKTWQEHKALEIMKECFVLNGFDEFIPNSKWFENEEKQKLLKEALK